MNISVEVLNFQSFDDFDCWKKTEESKTNSNFVLKMCTSSKAESQSLVFLLQ